MDSKIDKQTEPTRWLTEQEISDVCENDSDNLRFGSSPDCLTTHNIAGYVRGILPQGQMSEYKAHIDDCNVCGDLYPKVIADLERLQASGDIETPSSNGKVKAHTSYYLQQAIKYVKGLLH